MKILSILFATIICIQSTQSAIITLDIIEGKDPSGTTTLASSWDDGASPPSLFTGDFSIWIVTTTRDVSLAPGITE